MTDKSLKNKAIDIKKGKKYVLVSDRVTYFNEQYPNGSIETELVSDPTSEMVIVKATVQPNNKRTGSDEDGYYTQRFTGYSQAVIGEGMVNKTAALENAETSAVGRALGFMGIGVIESIASADEMKKATTNTMRYATEKQIKWLRDTACEVNDQLAGESDEVIDEWIENILTVKPAQVPIYKVKDAIDKLKEPEPITETTGVDVTDEDLKDLEDGTLPY